MVPTSVSQRASFNTKDSVVGRLMQSPYLGRSYGCNLFSLLHNTIPQYLNKLLQLPFQILVRSIIIEQVDSVAMHRFHGATLFEMSALLHFMMLRLMQCKRFYVLTL